MEAARKDAIVLLSDPTGSVLYIYDPNKVSEVSKLKGQLYGRAQDWMLNNGWKLLAYGSQFAHPLFHDARYVTLDKHFFVPDKVKIVPFGSCCVLRSVGTKKYLDAKGEFTLANTNTQNIQIFDNKAAALITMHKLNLHEAA